MASRKESVCPSTVFQKWFTVQTDPDFPFGLVSGLDWAQLDGTNIRQPLDAHKTLPLQRKRVGSSTFLIGCRLADLRAGW